MKYDNLDDAIAAYMAFLVEDYISFTKRGLGANNDRAEEMVADFANNLSYRKGKKYIKVISEGSVTAFIVVKDDGKFKAGDLLKAASWAAPAKNAARGNVLEGKFSGGWTGPQYM